MIKTIFTGKWSVYFSGILFAVFFLLFLYVLDSPVGMGDAYLMISEYCEEAIENKYIERFPFDWQTGFLLGLLGGGVIAAFVGGTWRLRLVSSGDGEATGVFSPLKGLAGGFLVMLGLQIAGDSFLGHWASAMQLSTGSWLFLVTVAVFGIIFSGIIRQRFSRSESSSEKSAVKEK